MSYKGITAYETNNPKYIYANNIFKLLKLHYKE